MSVKRLASDTQFGAQVRHFRFGLPHGRHRQAQLGSGHFEGSAAFSAAGAGRSQSGDRPLRNQLALELGQRRKDSKDQLACGGGGVEGSAVPIQHFESHAPGGQVMDGVDQVAKIASQAIERPHRQGVAVAQRLQAGRQARPIILSPLGHVLVELGRIDPGGDQRVALQVGGLGAICLRYPHVTNQHTSPVTYTFDKVT